MKKYQIKAFTLVELIIVITILAILATIGFMSYQSYTSDARDANRVTTVKQISDGLDITYVKKASYPMPDGTLSTGSINGITYAYRGTIGSNISQIIKMDKSVDPLSKEEYMYGVSSDKTQYQIALVLENNISQINSITNTTYAAGKETAKVNGNYPGYMKFASGSETWIANIPSLLWNNTGSVNLMNTGTYFVVDKKSNLPYKVSNNDLGTKNADMIIQEITGTGISKLAGVNITNLNKDNIGDTFTGVILASFGGDISKVTSNVIGGTLASTPTQDTPAPFVPSENFSVTTYAGNGGTLDVNNGLDMSTGNNGGLVWIKNRLVAEHHILQDTLRGNGGALISSTNGAELTGRTQNIQNWLTNGIKIGNDQNTLSKNYVAYSWKTTDKASGTTNHGKAYTANYNTRAGFSIVSYVGEGNNNSQIPHYLGKAPELIMIKDRGELEDWSVGGLFSGYASSTPKILKLNKSDAYIGAYNSFSDFSDTRFINDSVFTVDGSDLTNQLNHNYISYAFTSVPGFSKVGTYTGNGGTGNNITLGFEPAFVMIKSISSPGDWIIQDNKRGAGRYLWSNLTNTEISNTDFVFNTNGFTINGVSNNVLYNRNNTNGTYLYYAISK